uniref:Uncharacterized protein n=1 Tax=Vespula pensylvanica TaxID=30213 RepID=A0A834NF54_VESPE|nr:hypothetical protein H0235_014341 [Vespula pensylvanica]
MLELRKSGSSLLLCSAKESSIADRSRPVYGMSLPRAEQFTAGRSKFDVGIDWTTAARLALPPSRYFGIATPTRCRLWTQWTMEKRRLSDSKHSKELVGGFLTPCNVARACLWIVQNSPGAGGFGIEKEKVTKRRSIVTDKVTNLLSSSSRMSPAQFRVLLPVTMAEENGRPN